MESTLSGFTRQVDHAHWVGAAVAAGFVVMLLRSGSDSIMSIIYEPRGKAREYSELAANLYTGCSHGCRYCYCPAILRKKIDEWAANPRRHLASRHPPTPITERIASFMLLVSPVGTPLHM